MLRMPWMADHLINPALIEIRNIIETARNNITIEVNTELLVSYWKIGAIVVCYEQKNNFLYRIWSGMNVRHMQRRIYITNL